MPKPSPLPTGPPTPPASFCATPQYYHPIAEPPTRPGWYLCWCGPKADYLEWPGDWDGVTCWVELPRFVQELLSPQP